MFRLRIACGEGVCCKSYLYKKALISHYTTAHNFNKEEAKAKGKEAEAKALRDTFVGDGFEGEIKLVLYDLETTGLIQDEQPLPRIVEIACKNISGQETFETLVNPAMSIPASSTEVHKITDTMVAPYPLFERTGQLLVDWVNTFSCTKDVVIFIAHNGTKFDKPILLDAMAQANIPLPANWRFADSRDLFRDKYPNLGSRNTFPYSLRSLHLRFLQEEIDNHHRAAGDVLAMEKLLCACFGEQRVTVMENVIKALFLL